MRPIFHTRVKIAEMCGAVSRSSSDFCPAATSVIAPVIVQSFIHLFWMDGPAGSDLSRSAKFLCLTTAKAAVC